MSRWPVLVLVLAVLAGGVAYDRLDHVDPGAEASVGPVGPNPVATSPPKLSSVWYCPVGSAGGGYADHTVEVVNVGTEPAVATVSVLTDNGPGPSTRLDIEPRSRRQVALAQLETATAAGAVVEVVSGQGVVDHVVATPQGSVRGVCATAASEQWHFAGGVTTRDATHQIALLNPFAEDAVFDVRFEAQDRVRLPTDLQGAIVPARSVRLVDVSAVVAREGAVATTIELRRGQVVAERLQTFDGVLGPVGAALQLGSDAPAAETWFPAGRVHEGGDHRLVLYNPGENVAEVDVELQPHDPAMTASYGLVPLEISVGPRRFEIIDLVQTADQLGVPLPFEVGLRVLSVNGVPVVAERWSVAPRLDTTAIGAGVAPPEDAASEPAADPAAPDPPAADEGTATDAATTDAGAAAIEGGAEQTAPGAPSPGRPATAGAIVPVALGAPTQDPTVPAPGSTPDGADPTAPDSAPTPDAEDGAGNEDGAVDGSPDADVPADEVVPVPPLTQDAPSRGVVIDRGVIVTTATWIVPGVPVLPADGTVLVVVSRDEAATVEVRSATGPAVAAGEEPAPIAEAEVEAGSRVLIPIPSGEAIEDLSVSASAAVAVAVSLVDADGSLQVLAGIPILEDVDP